MSVYNSTNRHHSREEKEKERKREKEKKKKTVSKTRHMLRRGLVRETKRKGDCGSFLEIERERRSRIKVHDDIVCDRDAIRTYDVKVL